MLLTCGRLHRRRGGLETVGPSPSALSHSVRTRSIPRTGSIRSNRCVETDELEVGEVIEDRSTDRAVISLEKARGTRCWSSVAQETSWSPDRKLRTVRSVGSGNRLECGASDMIVPPRNPAHPAPHEGLWAAVGPLDPARWSSGRTGDAKGSPSPQPSSRWWAVRGVRTAVDSATRSPGELRSLVTILNPQLSA